MVIQSMPYSTITGNTCSKCYVSVFYEQFYQSLLIPIVLLVELNNVCAWLSKYLWLYPKVQHSVRNYFFRSIGFADIEMECFLDKEYKQSWFILALINLKTLQEYCAKMLSKLFCKPRRAKRQESCEKQLYSLMLHRMYFCYTTYVLW